MSHRSRRIPAGAMAAAIPVMVAAFLVLAPLATAGPLPPGGDLDKTFGSFGKVWDVELGIASRARFQMSVVAVDG